MPLEEAPETPESAEPSGTAGAITPGTGTLAGASIALAGTLVPSGRVWLPSAVLDAVALALTRLAVHTPDASASGTKAIALLRLDNGRLVILLDSLPWVTRCRRSPPDLPTRPSTTLPSAGHAQTSGVTHPTGVIKPKLPECHGLDQVMPRASVLEYVYQHLSHRSLRPQIGGSRRL